MNAVFITEPAKSEELRAVFRLVFSHLGSREREQRVTNALHLIQLGEIDPEGVIVARLGPDLLGGVVCLPVAGASALFWPPQAIPGEHQEAAEDALLAMAKEWVRGQGARLAQTLLAPQEHPLAKPLERNGFVHITNLFYMRFLLDTRNARSHRKRCLNYQPYPACSQQLFQDILLRTYESSLDCPELGCLRSPPEILEGHRAQGQHDPHRWWLAWDHSDPVAILMTTFIPAWQALDVSYVGVVPEARRRGLGKELMERALREGKAAGASQVTLAVDARNKPALDLYQQIGFEAFDRREVFLAIWEDDAPQA
jgi:mycothiol synthase